MQIPHDSYATPQDILPLFAAPLLLLDLLANEFELDVRRYHQLSTVPETVHITGEVFSELG